MFKDMIEKNRSYRRFHQEERITEETLLSLVNLARLSASGANKQPLRYILSSDRAVNEAIYSTVGWAGYLSDWAGPVEGERPAAYIVMVQDKNNKMVAGIDHGIAAQSILLGAVEKGLGGCIIASIQKDKLGIVLGMPEDYEILLVIALGKPKEVVVIEEVTVGEDIKYWRDEQQVHHVPKLKLADVILSCK